MDKNHAPRSRGGVAPLCSGTEPVRHHVWFHWSLREAPCEKVVLRCQKQVGEDQLLRVDPKAGGSSGRFENNGEPKPRLADRSPADLRFCSAGANRSWPIASDFPQPRTARRSHTIPFFSSTSRSLNRPFRHFTTSHCSKICSRQLIATGWPPMPAFS